MGKTSSGEIHGPQAQWKKEQEAIESRASRGPVKTWTANQRVAYTMELLETGIVNSAQKLHGELRTGLEVADGFLTEMDGPFEGTNLEETLIEIAEQVEDLLQDIRTLAQYGRDYRLKKGDFAECPSPTASATADPLSGLMGTGGATRS